MTVKNAGAIILAVGLLAGCGGDKLSANERASINAEFTRIDFLMSNSTLGAPPADQENLQRLTQQYVRATRKYADDLGKGEVTRRLEDKAVELQPFCLTCVAILDRERETYYDRKAR
jgi:hypothetical protein